MSGSSGWTADPNSITWPAGAGVGSYRIVAGGDTPPELFNSNRIAAILFYDIISGVEVGYHFISAGFDGPPAEATLEIGYVTYPIPGDPSSPTIADVHFQQKFGTQVSNNIEIADPVTHVDFIDMQGPGSEIYRDAFHHYPYCEDGTHQGPGFAQAVVGAASTTASVAVVYTSNMPGGSVPNVFTNLVNTAAITAQWGSKARSITEFGFTMFFYGPAPGGAGFTAGAQWSAQI